MITCLLVTGSCLLGGAIGWAAARVTAGRPPTNPDTHTPRGGGWL